MTNAIATRTIATNAEGIVRIRRETTMYYGPTYTELTYAPGNPEAHIVTTLLNEPWESSPPRKGFGGLYTHSFSVVLPGNSLQSAILTDVRAIIEPRRKLPEGYVKDYPMEVLVYRVGEDEITRSGIALVSLNQAEIALREAQSQLRFDPATASKIAETLLRRIEVEKKTFEEASRKRGGPESEQVRAFRRDMQAS